MCKVCPKCGAIAEYNAYYGRTTCTRCAWESEKSSNVRFRRKSQTIPNNNIRGKIRSAT